MVYLPSLLQKGERVVLCLSWLWIFLLLHARPALPSQQNQVNMTSSFSTRHVAEFERICTTHAFIKSLVPFYNYTISSPCAAREAKATIVFKIQNKPENQDVDALGKTWTTVKLMTLRSRIRLEVGFLSVCIFDCISDKISDEIRSQQIGGWNDR